MPFAPPTKTSWLSRIYLRLAGQSIPLTDMTTISSTRIFVEEALIEEFLDLYAGVARELRDWYFTTAVGDALTRRLADFGPNIPLPVALPAVSVGRFHATADTAVPAGLAVRVTAVTGQPLLRYLTQRNPSTSDGSWPVAADATVDVPIVAEAAGTAYNVAAGTVIEFDTTASGLDTVMNPYPIINGRDDGTDAEKLLAFQTFLQSNGGNRTALQLAMLDYTDPLTGAKPVHSLAFQEWNGTTLLSIGGRAVASILYVEDGTGAASGALLSALQLLVDGNDTRENPGIRGGGLPMAIASATPFIIPVTVAVDISPDVNPATAQAGVVNVVQQFIGRMPVSGAGLFGSQGTLVFAQLFKAVVDAPGVLRATFTFPNADLHLPVGYKAMPGAVAVAAHSVTL